MSFILAATLLLAQPIPVPREFNSATCDDPKSRAALLAANSDEPLFLVAMRERSAEREKRMDVLIARLVERAKLNDEQKGKIALSLLEAPGFDAAMKEGFGIVGDMMKDLSRLSQSKDERLNCLAVVRMTSRLPAIQANADKQWEIMEKALQAKAAALGVSLGP